MYKASKTISQAQEHILYSACWIITLTDIGFQSVNAKCLTLQAGGKALKNYNYPHRKGALGDMPSSGSTMFQSIA